LLTGLGHDCVVVAPSLISMKAGDGVKADRRLMLARLHRAGELTPICIPDAAHAAMRDLVRARATAVRALSQGSAGLSAVPRPDLPRGSRLDLGISTLAHHGGFDRPAQQPMPAS
jgi:transposase